MIVTDSQNVSIKFSPLFFKNCMSFSTVLSTNKEKMNFDPPDIQISPKIE